MPITQNLSTITLAQGLIFAVSAGKKGPGDYPSPSGLVEPGGIEPPSESPPQAVLHV